jgi:glycine cleavage system regulatory protein
MVNSEGTNWLESQTTNIKAEKAGIAKVEVSLSYPKVAFLLFRNTCVSGMIVELYRFLFYRLFMNILVIL